MFLVLEGADGVGKSTQAKLLAAHIERVRGTKPLLLREPGATALGEQVRAILLDPRSGELSPRTELFLFLAARAHLVDREIRPALERGRVVICDRFHWSSVVYQGIVGGVGLEATLRLGPLAGGIEPNRIFVLDLATQTTRRRLQGEDRMEQKGLAFQARVRRGFLTLARRAKRRAVVVDARGTPEDVHARLVAALPRAGWPQERR